MSLTHLYFIVNLGTIIAPSVISLSREENSIDFPFITGHWMHILSSAKPLLKCSGPKASRGVGHFGSWRHLHLVLRTILSLDRFTTAEGTETEPVCGLQLQ